MFERFTESARRALFFARYEASVFGSLSIETEHMLLGVLRDDGIVARLLRRAHVSPETLRLEIEARTPVSEKVALSVEIPFSPEMRRVLESTADEADRLLHSYIGKEHIFLALIRETDSVAGSILAEHGLRLENVRADLVILLAEMSASTTESLRGVGVVERIEEIKVLVEQLGRLPADSASGQELVERIRQALDALKPPSVADDESGLPI